jgi:D-arabinose 1-dehydrogenase-like Zn-dependent alcohol dehydrogenase
MASGGPGASFTAPPGPFFREELLVTGGRCCTKQELTESIEIVRQGRIRSIITQTFSLEEVEEAHRLIDEKKIFGRAVLVM